jgi:hypothetical protein
MSCRYVRQKHGTILKHKKLIDNAFLYSSEGVGMGGQANE